MARLSREEAVRLFKTENVFSLGRMAHAERMRRHPEGYVTYIVDRNINYTNVCMSGCKFCAFYCGPGDEGGYVLTKEELSAKVRETVELGGYQILLQGGMNPDLPLDFYTDMLSSLKGEFPEVAIHGFSPTEISYLAVEHKMEVADVIRLFVDAGLDSIPGGGAEILTDNMRQKVSPRKCTTDQWLGVMSEAHKLGLRTTATMMFGEGETLEERIEHLDRLREVQDETGGFTAFIPWTFQPDYTRMPMAEASSTDYLKMLAISRLYLDNFDNVQASWVTQGPMVGQLALFWGANDFGSTMIEENVVAAAGVHFRLPEGELRNLVESAGFTPRRRSMDYTLRD